MPSRLCLEPRCPRKAEYRGRCAPCSRDRERQTHPNKSVYGSKRWELLRRKKLNLNPICEQCDRVLASEVHHRVDIQQGGDVWAMANLESLCKPCHSRTTRRAQVESAY